MKKQVLFLYYFHLAEGSASEQFDMKSTSITNPHDKIFKHTFSNVENVQDFLKGSLPDEIVMKLNLGTLERDAESFVDDELREHFADIVYACQYGKQKKLEIAFLFEHKTQQPQYIYLQLLRYMLNVWEQRRKNGEPLRIILPLVIYHGRKAWKVRTFHEELGIDPFPVEFASFFPSFNYHLIDLLASKDAQIKASFNIPRLRVSLLLMKHIWDPNLLEKLPFILLEVKRVLEETGDVGEFIASFVYLLTNVPEDKKEKAMELVEEYTESGARVGSIMWAAEKKGYDEGLENGVSQVVSQILAKGLSIKETASLTGVSEDRVSEIKKNLDSKEG